MADITSLAILQYSFVQQCKVTYVHLLALSEAHILQLLEDNVSCCINYCGVTVQQALSTTHFSATSSFELCTSGAVSVASIKSTRKSYLDMSVTSLYYVMALCQMQDSFFCTSSLFDPVLVKAL